MSVITRTPEVDLLRPVVKSFRDRHFQVWQEVACEGMAIDCVADDDLTLIAIHGKTALNEKVLEQARLSQGVSDLTIVVVPSPRGKVPNWAALLRVAQDHGVGVTTVASNGVIREVLPPQPNHHAQADRLRAVLHDGQKDFAPAGSKSKQWTHEGDWIAAIRAELEQFGDLRLIDCDTLQRNSKDRVKRGAVVGAITRLYHENKLPFALLVSRGGQSYLERA